VEELEPEIWEAFARELLSHTESLASLVGRIRSMDREGLRECLLHAHSIKSLAGVLEEDFVASQAREVERFLEELLEGREHLDAERIGWLENNVYIFEGFTARVCGKKTLGSVG